MVAFEQSAANPPSYVVSELDYAQQLMNVVELIDELDVFHPRSIAAPRTAERPTKKLSITVKRSDSKLIRVE
jgi:hypothetical protein